MIVCTWCKRGCPTNTLSLFSHLRACRGRNGADTQIPERQLESAVTALGTIGEEIELPYRSDKIVTLLSLINQVPLDRIEGILVEQGVVCLECNSIDHLTINPDLHNKKCHNGDMVAYA